MTPPTRGSNMATKYRVIRYRGPEHLVNDNDYVQYPKSLYNEGRVVADLIYDGDESPLIPISNAARYWAGVMYNVPRDPSRFDTAVEAAAFQQLNDSLTRQRKEIEGQAHT